MGYINDALKTMRKVERTVDTIEKIDQSLYEQKIGTLVAQYEHGEISAVTFENEIWLYVNEPNAAIKIIAQDVNGVGESTATVIANEYRSLSDLEQTDRDRLESVRGIGPSTVEKVLERVQ